MQIQWSSHGGKHFPPAGVEWADIVTGTAHGPAKYKPGVDIERLDRDVWQNGEPVTSGKNWKVKELPDEIGASAGKK